MLEIVRTLCTMVLHGQFQVLLRLYYFSYYI